MVPLLSLRFEMSFRYTLCVQLQFHWEKLHISHSKNHEADLFFGYRFWRRYRRRHDICYVRIVFLVYVNQSLDLVYVKYNQENADMYVFEKQQIGTRLHGSLFYCHAMPSLEDIDCNSVTLFFLYILMDFYCCWYGFTWNGTKQNLWVIFGL